MSAAPATCCNAVLNPASATSCSPRAPQYTGPRPATWLPRTPPPPPSTHTAPRNWYRNGLLRDLAAASALRYVALRYFNVAGSDMGGRIGQATPGATLLIKVASEATVGKRPPCQHFRHRLPDPRRHRDTRLYPRPGSRRRTPVGTGPPAPRWRQCRAELRLRTRLQRAPGAGERAARIGPQPDDPRGATTRRGSAVLVAKADRIRSLLGWTPQLDDLDTIVRSSLDWEPDCCGEPW